MRRADDGVNGFRQHSSERFVRFHRFGFSVADRIFDGAEIETQRFFNRYIVQIVLLHFITCIF